MPHMTYDEADVNEVLSFAKSKGHNFNQDQGILAARDLDYVKAKVYERKIPGLEALNILPRVSDVSEWAETIAYKSFDQVGMAKIISNYADDLPRADVSGKEITVPVRTLGDSYGYNINELNASVALGVSLPQRKANAARLAIEVKQAKIALVGDEDHGLYGLTNHPNIGITVGTKGNWADPATTGKDIVQDVHMMYNAILSQSLNVHKPNLLALPFKAYTALKSKYLSNDSNKTAFDAVRDAYPDLRIEGFHEFNEIKGQSLAVMGEVNEDNIALEEVMPFNQLPSQARNLELVVPCMARTGGVSVHYPLALTKITGL